MLHKSCACAAAENVSADYGHDINARSAFFGSRTKTAQKLMSLHLYSAPSHSVRANSRMRYSTLPPATQCRRLAARIRQHTYQAIRLRCRSGVPHPKFRCSGRSSGEIA